MRHKKEHFYEREVSRKALDVLELLLLQIIFLEGHELLVTLQGIPRQITCIYVRLKSF